MALSLLPDFKLAPREYFPTDVLADAPADGFVLALSLFLNDLKFVCWTHDQLLTHPPDRKDRRSPYAGQRNGMLGQVERMICGYMHELFELIFAAARDGVLADPTLLRAAAAMNPSARRAWSTLVEVGKTRAGEGNSKGQPTTLRNYLCRVRQVAFHFGPNSGLLAGFKKHFVAGHTDPNRARAMASFGDTLESTRFYFADAAALALLQQVLPGGLHAAEGKAHLNAANEAIRHLVEAYLREKSPATST